MSASTLGTLSKEYIVWIGRSRDLSAHTLRAYRGDLERLEQSLGTDKPVGTIGRRDLVRFIDDERTRGLAPATVRRRAAATRGFMRWLSEQGLVDDSLPQHLATPRGRSRKLPRGVRDADVRLLLGWLFTAADLQGSSPRSLNGRPAQATTLMAVLLLLATGVRVSELTSPTRDNVDLEAGRVRITGKGRRERYVYLTNDWSRDLLSSYLAMRSDLGIAHAHVLFDRNGAALSSEALRARLGVAARQAGVEMRLTPHMLRHTAATRLVDAGVDIRIIQRLLGHASLSTTEIYTHVADPTLQRVLVQVDVLGEVSGQRARLG